MSRILIVTSNPEGTARLRLDKEHRVVDEARDRFGAGSDQVQRCHATNLDDLIRALTQAHHDMIQFSGHGAHEGFVLEDNFLRGPSLLAPDRLRAILREAQPALRCLILTCCYSSAANEQLSAAAPYLITVAGEGEDDALIGFVRVFYETFFHQHSIERAFYMAQLSVPAEAELSTVLTRRAEAAHTGHPLYQVFPAGPEARGDSIIVDLSAVEDDLTRLAIPRDRFLTVLSRKIRIHRWIFAHPHDRAILSMGHFFGVFSWKDAHDVVTCQRILRVKETVDEQCCEAWTSLTMAYNERYMAKYRLSERPASPENARHLKVAIEDFHRTYTYYFDDDAHASVFRRCLPQEFKICRSLVASNLQQAESKYHADDYGSAIAYVEMALSAVHDFVDALTGDLTE